jgi:hypothetical protein
VVGRRLLAVAALTLFGCGAGTPAGTPGPPPTGLVASLEDEVGAGGSWRTSWVLCWDTYPGAVAYELMTITGEGSSPTLRRQTDRCLHVEAAAGDGPPAERPARRAAQLAAQQGQLAFRVRGVPAHGPPGEWSLPVAVGTEGPAAAYRPG